jgi:hypothetical protein
MSRPPETSSNAATADRKAYRRQEAEHADWDDQPDHDGRQANDADRNPHASKRPAQARRSAAAVRAGRVAGSPATLIHRPHDAVGAGNC